MILKSPVYLKPSWLVRFFARFIVLPPLFIWLLWVARKIIEQPEFILRISAADWGMSLLLLIMVPLGLSMATIRIVLDDDTIEKRTIFGSTRLQLSEIGYRCHFYSRYVAIMDLYTKNAPRMFIPNMRVPLGLFSLSAEQEILKFIEPIPERDHWLY